MHEIVNPNFWDFATKGAPPLMRSPGVIPKSWQDKQYLCVRKATSGFSVPGRTLHGYTWMLAGMESDLFDGGNAFVFRKWPHSDIFELIWSKDEEPAAVDASRDCPVCKGTGEYVCDFYIDDCGVCLGSGRVTD